ncbi:hypothetical protein BDW42DRAFT_36196 [Aspergillus taichungensis]|uniref:SAM and PH domain protein n=1 Tax=Aspergillus taichungensis TaxID=482145 RepID=A0A2J5I4A9_9EURO|nr:hypothetical protein BDW42DRAFT_36196 [Aspergillus taichungensis]
MAAQTAYYGAYLGQQKIEAGPCFAPRTSIARPLSEATDILDSDHYDDDDDLSYPEDSPFTSVASFGAGSVSTASTPNEATTPESTGLTAFDFHIDEKTVKGPNGPHLFRLSSDTSDSIHEIETGVHIERPPSTLVPFYQSASKLDPIRRDTPVPNRVSSTPQPQAQPHSRQGSLASQGSTQNVPDVRDWTPKDVVGWLHASGFDDGIIHTFFVNDISGLILMELQTQDLKELGIQSFGKRHMLMNAIQNLRNGPTINRVESRASEDRLSYRAIPPTPSTGTTMTSGYSSSSSVTDGERSRKSSSGSRRRRRQETDPSQKPRDLEPGDSASIVAIEQILPRLHSCSKGENCRKWQKQQAKLAQLARDLPAGAVNGRIILTGDPGNPKTAPNLVKTPKSDVTPSLVASSDIMGPLQSPGLQLSKEKLNEVQPRDPQENVRNFLSFQTLSKLQPVSQPGTPPKETVPSPESDQQGSAKANPTLSENLRHLPKLQIPGSGSEQDMHLAPNWSSQRTATPSMTRNKAFGQDGDEDEELTAIPRGQRYAYGTTVSPGDFYRSDPHYGQDTPLSDMDAPMTAFPLNMVSREESQSVPPNMRFGTNRYLLADQIIRPASTKTGNHRRNTSHSDVPRLVSLDERRALNPIETPEDLENTPRLGGCYRNGVSVSSPTRRSPTDVTHSGWMKKRKTTRLLRHEWDDHHFTLQGTQLAMHNDEESARRNSKALEHIDVDDYAVACSSLASSSKLTAAFKKTVLKRKDFPMNEAAFGFSLIPATNNGGSTVDKKALFLNSGKSHHFAVKTRDERIDWMRELMLAKALKRGRDSGAFVNVNGNVI